MAKKSRIRKTIRIEGVLHQEFFPNREEADRWYNKMYSRKISSKHGLEPALDRDILFGPYAYGHKNSKGVHVDGEWLAERKRTHGPATYESDEQRLRDWVVPVIGKKPISKITSVTVRTLLQNLVTREGLSTQTRDRVRALISAVYNSAINRDPPLAEYNPTLGIKFTGKRTGKKNVSFLSNSEKVLKFFEVAKYFGGNYLVYAALFLMTGPRKQDGMALKWDCINFTESSVVFKRKYVQASDSIVTGTKKGEETSREVIMPDTLLKILKDHYRMTEYSDPDDFVLSKPDGGHLSLWDIRRMHRDICKKAELVVTVHGLRHSFGREFAQRSKNLKALQEILGHSSFSTTEIYSELGNERRREIGNAVDLGTFDAVVEEQPGDEDVDSLMAKLQTALKKQRGNS